MSALPVDQDFSFLRAMSDTLRRGFLDRARSNGFMDRFKDAEPTLKAAIKEWQDNLIVVLEVMEERDLEAKRARLLAGLVHDVMELKDPNPALRRLVRRYLNELKNSTTLLDVSSDVAPNSMTPYRLESLINFVSNYSVDGPSDTAGSSSGAAAGTDSDGDSDNADPSMECSPPSSYEGDIDHNGFRPTISVSALMNHLATSAQRRPNKLNAGVRDGISKIRDEVMADIRNGN